MYSYELQSKICFHVLWKVCNKCDNYWDWLRSNLNQIFLYLDPNVRFQQAGEERDIWRRSSSDESSACLLRLKVEMKVQLAWAESIVWLRQPSKFEADQTNKWLRQFCNFAASIWLSIAQPLLALHLFCCGDQSVVEVYFYILSDEQAYVLEMVSHLKRESEFLHHIKSILFLLSPSLKSVLILFASPMANLWLFRSLAKQTEGPLSVVATGKCAIM